MSDFRNAVIGVAYSPKVVAATRSLVLYALPIVITLVVGWLNTITDPRYYGIALACVPLVRALGEGILDQVKRPEMNDINPPPVAGSGDGQMP